MRPFMIAGALLGFATASLAQSPAPLRLQWKTGQINTYAVKQTTTVEETILAEGTNKPQSGKHSTTMQLAYTWTVRDVDAKGIATIDKTVVSFKSESTRTTAGKDGQPESVTDTLDSTVAADREKMPFLNKVAVTAKVDGLGNVIEAKSEFGDAAMARFKTELPFRLTLSEKPLTPGLAWERAFAITLDPKYGGTGEQYPAVQKCSFKGLNGSFAIIGVSTALKDPPQNASDLRPLIPMLWEGDVFIDAVNGRFHACKLVAAKELTNHEGDGTKFSYRSEYVELLQEKK
jgi:hypothetical protein